MIQQTFQHRSGRVISLSRALLALVFPIGIWLDSPHQVRHPDLTFALLFFYLIAAAVFLAATWDNWRLETRLAVPALVVDLCVFAGLVLLTEGYANPFFPFFVFIVMSAALRWSWRETALTAAALIAIFLAASAASAAGFAWETAAFDPQRFFFRSAFLVVLSFVLVWFGFNQIRPRMPRLAQARLADPAVAAAPPIREAAEFVAAHSDARRVVFAWWNHEEPWTNVATWGAGVHDEIRHGPGEFGPLVDPAQAGSVFLFDFPRDRILRREDGRRSVQPLGGRIDAAFAQRYALTAGLAIPIDSSGYGGIVFALDVPGLCSDDVVQGAVLGEEVCAAFERASTMALLADAAGTRARLALSRDLHDSVLQLLAGTSLRLEGVKRSLGAGRPVDDELAALQRDLIAEQRDVRSLIGRLRGGDAPGGTADLHRSLRELAERMSRQWNIACRVDHGPNGLEASALLERDCRQLVREAVANAVRHGRASAIAIGIEDGDDAIRLVVTDNGTGFPDDKLATHTRRGKAPWSLDERVRALGGEMAVDSSSRGAQITISLPYGRPA